MKKLTFIFIFFLSIVGYSQVTSSSITGFVKSNLGERLPGVTVQAIHTPTGTKYYGETDGAGLRKRGHFPETVDDGASSFG